MCRIYFFLTAGLAILFAACEGDAPVRQTLPQDTLCASFIADPIRDSLRLFWKDPDGHRYGSLGRLRQTLDSTGLQLRFAMNGGMYMPDGSPQGLYIESGRALVPLDSADGNGNFYLKPNGVFSLSGRGVAKVTQTDSFRLSGNLRSATQSGPMLLIDGRMHPAFKQGSTNLNFRNGVGILKDGRVLFAISKKPVNFYDFAAWFKARGCSNALYLDGLVSRAYIPSAGWKQLDGDFGVIVGVTERK
jgi:uncharacterized protein YigE (DUF2233 family)